MDLRVYPDPAALAHAVATEVAGLAAAAIAARGRFVVVLGGGATPAASYDALATLHRDAIDWRRVEFFWGDERAVGPAHADSNYGMADRTLLAPLGIAPRQRHRMRGDAGDLEAAAREYEREIVDVLGSDPRFDLVWLGMGRDGHTLSLFPHSGALREDGRLAVVTRVPSTGAPRLTLTFPVIGAARAARVIVQGADKTTTLRAALFGRPDPDGLPAQRLADAPNTAWMFDMPAALGGD